MPARGRLPDLRRAPHSQHAFGQRLLWLRLAWEEREPGHHSQEQWAEALGVDRAAVSRWETGRWPMPADLVWRVVIAMGATWDYLYGGLIGPGMEPWLASHLKRQYPGAIVAQKTLRDIRAELLATMRLRHYRPARRLGRPPRKPESQPPG